MDAYFGRTARLVEEAETGSHFQKAVVKIGDYLIVMAFALVVLIFLVAIEEMAGVDLLCSDKTGTITKNEIEVAEMSPLKGTSGDEVLLFGFLASREENEDPIDNAIIKAARDRQGIRDQEGSYRVEEFTPFDPVSKRTEAQVRGKEGHSYLVTKGAPQAVLAFTGDRKGEKAQVEALAGRGYRALGVATEKTGEEPTFLGLLALFDPPRDDSAETVRILFFITLSILVFNFYPVTAMMIVLLALLNDGPIMAIAYDRADYSPGPVRWDMRTVLGISTFLGLVGVAREN